MQTFSVRNFEKFQHYKDRNPPWIKLYNEVLDDYEFGSLPDASKAHLLAIWLLASRTGNRLPFDPEWIRHRINATEPVNLALLAERKFIVVDQALQQAAQDASALIQTDDGDARPETEQRQRREETEESGAGAPAAPDKLDIELPVSLDRLCQEAMNRWNTMAAEIGLAQAKQLTEPRRKALKARLGECGGLDGWDAALKKVRESRFLRGDSRDGWRADLDFVLQAKSFTKLMEGAYDNRDVPRQRRNFSEPAPSIEQPWERRVQSFKEKRIWLGTWGPAPDQPGCFAPSPILKQYGYGEAA